MRTLLADQAPKGTSVKTTKTDMMSPSDIDRIILMAWEDRTSFDAIRIQYGLTPGEVISVMRRELKPSSSDCGGLEQLDVRPSTLLFAVLK